MVGGGTFDGGLLDDEMLDGKPSDREVEGELDNEPTSENGAEERLKGDGDGLDADDDCAGESDDGPDENDAKALGDTSSSSITV